jgi:hypothetical protein
LLLLVGLDIGDMPMDVCFFLVLLRRRFNPITRVVDIM